MGRMSRLHRERRERRRQSAPGNPAAKELAGQEQADHIAEMEQSLKELSYGSFETFGDKIPPEAREAHLEDILAFESVGSGTSLFQGLEEHGVDLPPPEKLDELQSVEKISEVMCALADLGVFWAGFEHLSPRKFYSTLWHRTLWEGCYIERRAPASHHHGCVPQDVALRLAAIYGRDEEGRPHPLSHCGTGGSLPDEIMRRASGGETDAIRPAYLCYREGGVTRATSSSALITTPRQISTATATRAGAAPALLSTFRPIGRARWTARETTDSP